MSKNTLEFKMIEPAKSQTIIPLLRQLNDSTPDKLLNQRVKHMFTYRNYYCVGMFENGKLIGICGLWVMHRHYVGKSVEPDHLVIDENYRNNDIGSSYFKWLEEWCKQNNIEAIELNTYTGNRKSHKFYGNLDFEIYGFHYVKVIREDKKFY